MQVAPARVESGKAAATRIQSVDLLRGLVMVIMAIDHIRDFFHADAYRFSPEDLTRTTAILFFTRWITHFCAPIFVFLSGVSVHLSSSKRDSRSAVSRHLITRGMWLIVLEWTLLEFMWTFNFHYQIVILQVIWVIGCSMIALAALIWLPRRVLAALALMMILLHNAFDGISPAQFGNLGWMWNVLHAPNLFLVGQTRIFVLYPLVPWIGVMAAGYCFGPVLQMEEGRRRRVLLRLGSALTVAFFALRFANIYADPQPWSIQHSALLTLLSFFRVTKYPPSLDYLLMTLGPAILTLELIDKVRVGDYHPLRVFGRVPMFYYICHFYLLHAAALLFSRVRYGRWDYFLHFPGALLGIPDANFPRDWGYSLGQVYLIWLAIVAALYFPCRWYLKLKRRSNSPLLSYL